MWALVESGSITKIFYNPEQSKNSGYTISVKYNDLSGQIQS